MFKKITVKLIQQKCRPPSEFCRWRTVEVFRCSSWYKTVQSCSFENIL